MTNILAINPAAKEAVERQDKKVMEEEFRAFVKDSPEVRAMMIDRVKEAIAKMSAWDVSYHGRFNEAIAGILRQPEVQTALEAATKRVLLDTGDNLNYQIIQAVGEYLAG